MEFSASGKHRESGAMSNFLHGCLHENADIGRPTLFLQHSENILRRSVTEQLAERLFVIRNAVLIDKRDEVRRGVTCQRGFAEMRISGQEILRCAMQISEVAPASAGNQDLLPDSLGMFKHSNTATAFASFNGAHETGSTGTENDCVKRVFHGNNDSLTGSEKLKSGYSETGRDSTEVSP